MTKLLAILLLFISISFADESDPFEHNDPRESAAKLEDFPDWSFCVVYNFRDNNEKDRRPNPFYDKSPSSKKTYIPKQSLMIPVYMFDTAGLLSRTVSHARIDKETAKTLLNTTLTSKGAYPEFDCYEPHHLVVFYGEFGIPVGCIEVCFTCNAVKVFFRKEGIKPAEQIFPLNQPNFLSIAKIFDKAGVSMLPFKSLADYKQKSKPKK